MLLTAQSGYLFHLKAGPPEGNTSAGFDMWLGSGLMKGVRGTFWAEEEMYKGLSFVVSRA